MAAQGYGYAVYYKGMILGVGGTSTSAPAFAAIISMLNDARLNAGKSSLGFLNPWLYSTGFTALNDIKNGSNPGCGTEGFPVSALHSGMTRELTLHIARQLRVGTLASIRLKYSG